MSRMKKIVIGLFIIVLGVVFMSEDLVKSYAINHEIHTFEEGNLYKSGDTIKVLDPFHIVQSDEDESQTSEVYYTYIVNFTDSEGYYAYIVYDSYEDYTPCSNNDYKMTLPKVSEYNDETGDYEDKDAYWVIDSIVYDDYYSEYTINIKQIEYSPPVAKLECDAQELGANDSTECRLTVEYIEKLNKLDFEINSDLFAISDEEGLNNWNVTKDNNVNNKYSLVYNNTQQGVVNNVSQNIRPSFLSNTNPTMLASSSLKDVFKFKVTMLPDVEATSLVGNIKIQEIKYVDEKGNGLIEPQMATLDILTNSSATSNKEEKNEEKNPATSDNILICGLIVISIMAVVSYMFILKKRLGISRFTGLDR